MEQTRHARRRQEYGLATLRADAMAGLTVAAVAVPQAMAYAQIAGVRPEYALYTAIIPTALAALLGSSSHLIFGPKNDLSLLVFAALALVPQAAEHPGAVFVLALMAGGVQLLIALLKLGDLTRYVSEAVLLGFLLGAGILVAVGQVDNVLGLSRVGTGEDHPLYRVLLTLRYGGAVNYRAVGIAVATLALIVFLRRVGFWLGWRVPALLVAMLLVSLTVWGLGWSEGAAIPVVGAIPNRLPLPGLPSAPGDLFRPLAGSALAIALMGIVESLAVAKSIAARTRQRLDFNRQCMAEGLANVVGSVFHCLPGGGSLTRSAVNYQAGAVTRVSGVVCAAAVAATVLLFAPLARYVPRAALAGMLLWTAWRLVDRRRLAYCLRATRSDAITAVVTAVAAVLIGIDVAVFIGVFLSFLFFVPRAAKLQAHELIVAPGRMVREREPGDPQCGRLAIFSLEGELFFGASPELDEHLREFVRRVEDGVRVVVLRLKRARNPDVVCAERLHQFVEDLHRQGAVVLFCGVRPDFARILTNLNSSAWLPVERLFVEETTVGSSTLHAVRYAYELLGQDRCSTCPSADTGAVADAWRYEV